MLDGGVEHQSSAGRIQRGREARVAPKFVVAVDKHSSRPWWQGIRAPWRTLNFLDLAPDIPPPPRLWVTGEPPPDARPPVVSRDAVIIAGASGEVLALASETGSVRWRAKLDPVTGPPTLTADGVLVPHGGKMSLLDPASSAIISDRVFEELSGGDRIMQAIVTGRSTLVITADGEVLALANYGS